MWYNPQFVFLTPGIEPKTLGLILEVFITITMEPIIAGFKHIFVLSPLILVSGLHKTYVPLNFFTKNTIHVVPIIMYDYLYN